MKNRHATQKFKTEQDGYLVKFIARLVRKYCKKEAANEKENK